MIKANGNKLLEFIIIGMAKCGATSLYGNLNKHWLKGINKKNIKLLKEHFKPRNKKFTN